MWSLRAVRIAAAADHVPRVVEDAGDGLGVAGLAAAGLTLGLPSAGVTWIAVGLALVALWVADGPEQLSKTRTATTQQGVTAPQNRVRAAHTPVKRTAARPFRAAVGVPSSRGLTLS